ncbi:hypothetical protein ACI3KS_12415 [Microbacterium sp. ZW T5_45]|uniref:hypothetical protein n=1 Tax=Microbacterium sp. ZW T5_45 TaxID=3378080 RepID=UPI003853A218
MTVLSRTLAGSLDTTPILDHESAEVRRLVERSRDAAASEAPLGVLAAAHGIISAEVKAVYSVEERTPASRTLARGFGSCSQRLAALESTSRAIGIPTRVRALHIDRAFWYPRFPVIRFALPRQVLLIWPEFDVGGWRPASELFGPIGCRGGGAFTNSGSETLFEAAGRCAIDWDGTTGGEFDLSRFVKADHGRFANRDDAFRELGQTLRTPVRQLAEPVLRRVAA